MLNENQLEREYKRLSKKLIDCEHIYQDDWDAHDFKEHELYIDRYHILAKQYSRSVQVTLKFNGTVRLASMNDGDYYCDLCDRHINYWEKVIIIPRRTPAPNEDDLLLVACLNCGGVKK